MLLQYYAYTHTYIYIYIYIYKCASDTIRAAGIRKLSGLGTAGRGYQQAG